ncbi:MAG: phosphatase PAP2 family protein [Thermodesulfobacteriota bacterium]|nr:phosphatase PAP2 family protein [Thermodesulfobacteriota bacterium]
MSLERIFPADVPRNQEIQNKNANNVRKGLMLLALLSSLLVIATWFIIQWDLDRLIAGQFYTTEKGWYLRHEQPWSLIYHYGTIPGLLLTLIALIGWSISLIKPKFRHIHRVMLVVILTAVIGSGIIVNGILKNYWGHPRPRQVQEFGGEWEYHSVSKPGVPGKGKGFPCGHCTMGFLFCTLIFFRRYSVWFAYGGFFFGIAWGTVISFTRVVQGAHFPSSALWSLGIVMMVAVALYYLVLQVPKKSENNVKGISRLNKRLIGIVILIAGIAICIGFMLHRPFYKTHVKHIKPAPKTHTVFIETNADIGKLTTRYSSEVSPRIIMDAWGFSWTNVSHKMKLKRRYENGKLHILIDVKKGGYFAELTHELVLYLPEKLRDRVNVELTQTQNARFMP